MTFTELAAFIAVMVSLYSIISQRHYVASQAKNNFTQADSTNVKDALLLKAEYKADLRELRADLDAEKESRVALEEKLKDEKSARMALEEELRDEKDARMELQQRIMVLEEEREELEAGIARLIAQILYLGHIPDWQPRPGTGPLKPKLESKP